MTYPFYELRKSTAIVLTMCLFVQNDIYAQSISPPAGASVGPAMRSGRAGASGVIGPAVRPAGFDVGSARNNKKKLMLRDLHVLQERLKDAVNKPDDDVEKRQVTEQIESTLSNYFDSDLVLRRTEIQRVKKRVEQAEALLSKRESAKQDLVDLQVESFKHKAQGLELLDANQRKNRSSFGFYTRVGTRSHGFGSASLPTDGGAMSDAKVRVEDAFQLLKHATPGDSESRALEDLNVALIEYFDSDMKFRRKEIEEIEAGLEEMEALLEKRTKAKQAIINLQLRMIVNEAMGLGFFNGALSSSSTGFHSGVVRYRDTAVNRLNRR